jgi:Ca2+-binding EF-hand superfamily protein
MSLSDLNADEKNIFKQLNKLRTDPESFKDKFNLVAKGLARMPNKKSLSKELDRFAKSLKGYLNVKSVQLSQGLNSVADDIATQMSKKGVSYFDTINRSDFKTMCRQYVGGFKKLEVLNDCGDISDLFARAIVAPNDPDRQNINNIFEKHMKYCGIASIIIDNEPASIIILADDITEGASKPEYEPDEYPEFYEAFELFDYNKRDTVDFEDIKKRLLDLGFYHKSPTVFEIIVELENSGEALGANFNNFMEAIFAKLNSSNSKGLKEIFRLYQDYPEQDEISLRQLKKITSDLGEKEMYEEVCNLIKLANSDTITMSFADFYGFYFPADDGVKIPVAKTSSKSDKWGDIRVKN